MRLWIMTCLTCLLLGVASFVAILQPGLQAAHAQDCVPETPGTTSQPPSSQGSIVLNEVELVPLSASLSCTPSTSVVDIANAPRIELYNTSAQAIQLSHGSIDSGANTTPYYLSPITMAAHSFIVIFLPTNLTPEISKNALIRLLNGENALDQVKLPALQPGTSYARTSDGGSHWSVALSPTLGISNVPPPPQVTATASIPKATATPKVHRSTPTPSAKSSSRTRKSTLKPSGSDQASNPTKIATKPPNQGTYIQADWKDVHVPTPEDHPGTINNVSPSPESGSAPASDGGNIPQKIILSVLLLALTLVVWHWRRLFRRS
ncbi:hypothetical protein KDH_69970 [Dictyobacter sp. S3.2.2.5]|uniref:LTD domain-containing protein n=1 Tax=Dictyobacter halimunensis TaxID=3026934 RepID=A0ABQ6G5U8_9CHLR|nr:hypothetical protein KDH_69970 [Dictyobacter sp. S3.2.2.5]